MLNLICLLKTTVLRGWDKLQTRKLKWKIHLGANSERLLHQVLIMWDISKCSGVIQIRKLPLERGQHFFNNHSELG